MSLAPPPTPSPSPDNRPSRSSKVKPIFPRGLDGSEPLSAVASGKRSNKPKTPSTSPAPSREFIHPVEPGFIRNTGTVARDHLALERTILAYIRTSLVMTLIGVGLAQFLAETEHATSLGIAMVSLALVVLCIGGVRFITVQTALMKGHFPVGRATIMFIASFLGALMLASFAVIFAGRQKGE